MASGTKTLALSKETLRYLTASELERAAGGNQVPTECPSPVSLCLLQCHPVSDICDTSVCP